MVITVIIETFLIYLINLAICVGNGMLQLFDLLAIFGLRR